MGKMALTRHERFHAAKRAGMQVHNAGGAEHATARVTFAWIRAEFCANWALQFAAQIDVR